MPGLDPERLSIALPPLSAPAVIAYARAVEEAGFGGIWTADQYGSAFVHAAALAATTRRLTIGTAIAQAFVRSPLVTALSALDLQDLSGGRFRLGLGSGVRRLVEEWHGVSYGKPASRLRECALLVRELMQAVTTGEPVDFRGQYYSIGLAGYRRPSGPTAPAPIYLTGVRPGMVQLMAQVGDGLLGHLAFTPAWLEGVVAPAIRAGLGARAPGSPPLRLVVSVCVSVDPDREAARRLARLHVALLAAGRAYEEIFAQAGFQDRAARLRSFGEDVAGAAREVTDDMVDAFTVSGTPGEVAEGLAARLAAADELLLAAPAIPGDPDPQPAARRLLLLAG